VFGYIGRKIIIYNPRSSEQRRLMETGVLSRTLIVIYENNNQVTGCDRILFPLTSDFHTSFSRFELIDTWENANELGFVPDLRTESKGESIVTQ